MAAPLERGAVVLGQLARLDLPGDPRALQLLAAAATNVGAFDQAFSLYGAAAARLRDQGRLGVLARILSIQSWSAILVADFPVALTSAEEGARLGDLAEAAAHSGHLDEARSLMSRVGSVAGQTPSPWLHATLRYARAVLADDENAEAAFKDAADGQDMARWPFLQARLQLAFGEWLRRQRRIAESRVPLRSARDAFDALGATPWGERARQELRAAGETSRRRAVGTVDVLTTQELQIVQLAAAGLSNREIGRRLYLSHRTVESHLYRAFPKLGITSRAQHPGLPTNGMQAPG